MWLSFVLCVLLAVIVLFVPGYCVLRALHFSNISSVAAAPAVTVPGYAILCIALSVLDISASGWLVFGGMLAFGLLCLIASFFWGSARFWHVAKRPENRLPKKKDWPILLLYLAMGMIIGTFFFVKSLDTPTSFFQDYDNVFHLNVVQSFLSSGDWSCLHVSVYTQSEFAAGETPRTSWGGYYPAAWHCVNAVVADFTSCSLIVVQNSFLYVFAFVVFPLGMFLFMRALFPNDRKIVVSGALIALAFNVFPWGLLYWGPVYPNLTAFSLLPITASLFLALFWKGGGNRLGVTCMLFILSAAGYAFIQPNGVFSLAAVFSAFVVCEIYKAVQKRYAAKGSFVALFASVASVIGIVAAWVFLFRSSFLSAVVSVTWLAWADTSQAILYASTFAMNYTRILQPLLSALVFAGMLYTLSDRRYLWMTISTFLIMFIFVVDVTMDGTFKQLLGGFWYTDENRIGAMVVFVAIPLASIGLVVILNIFERLINCSFERMKISGLSSRGVMAVGCLLMVTIIYFPYSSDNSSESTSFGKVRNRLVSINDQMTGGVLDADERVFLREVKEIVGDDLVINSPADGSMFAYALYDLNTYYRSTRNYDDDVTYIETGETKSSYLIRTALGSMSDNSAVKEAVEDVNAKYVLVLGSGSREVRTFSDLSYDSYDWRGIDNIDEDTPGFTLMLERDGMMLFEIEQ